MGMLPHIFTLPERHSATLDQVASALCSTCGTHVYPHKGAWYCCNACFTVGLCGNCWNKEHDKHMRGRHTFTDMHALLPYMNGFPVIENKRDWFGKRPYASAVCDHCKTDVGKRFFHCNHCTSPGYDLCEACMVGTDAWRTHGNGKGASHTFTNAHMLI
ncbi:hypothetical protein STCU_11526 [Strigomonas culicis]|uniref:ZZ-type domain-containing protein n=1 Tax=Strigomonas culicis TaxID=28005 RepID=S9TGX6_9TRYP|nr:hypothetical protein STCU_11526 [Strigomonas culicis]|eukprot:EPY16144.1 hypothetical protein STCU_11526 [Strigomonas culicis]